MSFSDLGSGLFNILLSAGLCSSASPFLLREYIILPTIIGIAMWWFSFVSMYSPCWLILSKNVAITMSFHSDQLLPRKRCHVINGLTWLVAFCFSVVILSEDLKFDEGICSYTYSNDSTLQLYYPVVSVFTLFLPRALLIWGTMRIIIIVMRTHRQIAAQARSVSGGQSTSGTVTANTLRSSINIILIGVVSIVLSTPIVINFVQVNTSRYWVPPLFGFVCVWMFQLNTVANGVRSYFDRSERK